MKYRIYCPKCHCHTRHLEQGSCAEGRHLLWTNLWGRTQRSFLMIGCQLCREHCPGMAGHHRNTCYSFIVGCLRGRALDLSERDTLDKVIASLRRAYDMSWWKHLLCQEHRIITSFVLPQVMKSRDLLNWEKGINISRQYLKQYQISLRWISLRWRGGLSLKVCMDSGTSPKNSDLWKNQAYEISEWWAEYAT